VCALGSVKTNHHKTVWKEMFSDLLSHYEADDKSFLVTVGDETRIHQFELRIKRQSMEWHHPASPRKKLKAQQGKAWPPFFFGMQRGDFGRH